MDQVVVCRDALPRWGTSSSERRRRAMRSGCFSSSARGLLDDSTEIAVGWGPRTNFTSCPPPVEDST